MPEQLQSWYCILSELPNYISCFTARLSGFTARMSIRSYPINDRGKTSVVYIQIINIQSAGKRKVAITFSILTSKQHRTCYISTITKSHALTVTSDSRDIVSGFMETGMQEMIELTDAADSSLLLPLTQRSAERSQNSLATEMQLECLFACRHNSFLRDRLQGILHTTACTRNWSSDTANTAGSSS